ncbi:MAG TPA: STAS domain-containing protein [Micromonosporaceae bacterium]|nr:STAS domain-containing protein [Micromonosporaceae bacterium]
MPAPVVATPTYGRIVEISLRGEIDLSNAHQVRDLVTDILAGPHPEQIRCDMRLVSMIDSVGIGVLVACYHAAAACRVPFVVVNPTLTVYRQLWVSGLIGLFGSPEPVTGPSRPVPAHE